MCFELYSTLLYELLNVVGFAIIMKGKFVNVVGFANYNYGGRNCVCCWIC